MVRAEVLGYPVDEGQGIPTMLDEGFTSPTP